MRSADIAPGAAPSVWLASKMFAGLLCSDGSRSPAGLVDAEPLLAALSPGCPPHATGTWHEGPFLLVQATTRGNQPAQAGPGTATLPYRCAESGRVVAFWGRLDDRDALARKLGLPVAAATDEHLVLAAYDRWGTYCPEKLNGDFAGAICDPRERRAFLFRDRLGVKPVYYLSRDGFLLFATTAAVFPHLRRHAPVPDLDWAARLLAGASPSQTATGWTGVVKLAPGHVLDVRPGQTCLGRYHAWRDDAAWTTRRNPSRVDEYRWVLEEAVRCRMRGAELIASECSGGLDSSTVTALLAQFLGDPAERLFAFGFAMSDLEPEYIIETSRHAGIVYNYLLTGLVEPTDAAIGRGLAAVGYPEEAESAIGHIPFYEESHRRGIGTLFSGFGGDEAATNSGSLLRRELLDHGAHRALWRLMPGGRLTRTLRVVKARAWGRRWGAGHPALVAAMKARWPHQLVRAEVVERLGLLDAYMEGADYDAPYRRINTFVLQNRLGAWVARRLETCTLVAATYGVEYQWPLLDSRLIQQYLSTPSIEKADGTAGRYLHRRAIEGVVPAKVAWKPDKDMGGTGSGLIARLTGPATMEEARRNGAHVHPALEELIEVAKFRDQIEAAASGRLDDDASFQFARNVEHVRWLNHWLSGGPPPG